jgi:tetratricopeptide (TPR) repeat protein
MFESRLGRIVPAALLCLVLFVPSLALAQRRDKATALDQQATQLYEQGHYSEALPLAQRALVIREKALSPYHPDVAVLLHNLARLYSIQGRYADAEPLYKRSLAIREKASAPNHPAVADSLFGLAQVYHAQGRFADAEPLTGGRWRYGRKLSVPITQCWQIRSTI